MKSILLIEDHPHMRENIAEILELASYKVYTAMDGKIGVRLAQQHLPDLIISDIMMPELDGYGVLHLLSKDPKTACIPFVFLTAKAEKTDHRMGMSLGADDYLTKPFENSELLRVVEIRLRKSERLKEEFGRSSEDLHSFLNQETELSVGQGDREKKVLRKKESLYEEGQYPRGVYFIEKGRIKTGKTNEDGKEYITGLYKEGDFVGYTALIEEQRYSDAAVALDDSEVILIPKEEFFSLLYSNREVARKFIRMLSGNLQETEARLLKLAYNSVRKRVAEALLLLQERYASKGESLNMAITREDLASLVGTATETVTRTLADFKEEGLVMVKGSQITLTDPKKLEKIRN